MGLIAIDISFPNYTEEEMEQLLQDEKEKSAKLTEWQKCY